MDKPKLCILVVDDHDIVLKGITYIIADALTNYDLTIDSSTSGKKALQMLSTQKYDICLLDIEMPDIDGISILNTIHTKYPSTNIIVNTIHEELWYVKEYLRNNVKGILFKSVKAEEIAHAVLAVAEGNTYYCKDALAAVKIVKDYKSPTPKELEVLHLLATGKSTEEIAETLYISPNTAETHRRHLLLKLGADNVAELIMNAVNEGLLKPGR